MLPLPARKFKRRGAAKPSRDYCQAGVKAPKFPFVSFTSLSAGHGKIFASRIFQVQLEVG